MTRALVLNAGASWAAYQVGALEHLVGDRGETFDHHVGCGIGAMNAAFVACDELDALTTFWDAIGTWRLARPSPTPWRAPLRNSPQRRFVERHVSERLLRERDVTLSLTTFDLRSGDEIVHRYPGDPVPVVDALMAAVATPGVMRPLREGERLLAEATLVDSVPMAAVADLDSIAHVDHVTAILTGMPIDGGPRRRYRTWRAVMERSLEMNLANDVRRAIATHGAAEAWYADAGSLLDELGGLGVDVAAVASALDRGAAPAHLRAIIPSEPLGYPLWRFPRRAMHAARELGGRDARRSAS